MTAAYPYSSRACGLHVHRLRPLLLALPLALAESEAVSDSAFGGRACDVLAALSGLGFLSLRHTSSHKNKNKGGALRAGTSAFERRLHADELGMSVAAGSGPRLALAVIATD